MKPKMINVLIENCTIVDLRNLKRIVRMGQEAEAAGFDMVMISDHIVMGPNSGSTGRMENPRDYAMPGNQNPATP
jgi:alkanesulfonate monooxygenase SsuD/methylene tetrahydromethanopterin reductase-like flavin-dependent oxidoreductase (luciferase family)